jgi:hypothetical protein
MDTNVMSNRADDAGGLPRPRRGSRWRWATPRRTLLAGGAMATALAVGVGASGAGAATTPGRPPAGTHGRPPAGSRPTVAGKITALHGDDVTVQTQGRSTTTVVYSSGTTFESVSGSKGATSASSASALKVGAFIAVHGTKNGDGTVTASSVVIGGGPPRAGKGGPGPGPGGPSPAGAPSA